MRRRLLVGSLLVAVAVVVAFTIVRAQDRSADSGAGGGPTDEVVVLDRPGVEQIPSIATNAPVDGEQLPDVPLTTNDGAVVRTSELLGQPLVLNVWNSTCKPCEKELPAFAEVHAEYGDRVRFVGVNTLDVPEVNESFARSRGVGYELLRDVDGAFVDAVGIALQPVTLFVDADGTIVEQTGVLDRAALTSYVEELLS